jgi:hypothetical protein
VLFEIVVKVMVKILLEIDVFQYVVMVVSMENVLHRNSVNVNQDMVVLLVILLVLHSVGVKSAQIDVIVTIALVIHLMEHVVAQKVSWVINVKKNALKVNMDKIV